MCVDAHLDRMRRVPEGSDGVADTVPCASVRAPSFSPSDSPRGADPGAPSHAPSEPPRQRIIRTRRCGRRPMDGLERRWPDEVDVRASGREGVGWSTAAVAAAATGTGAGRVRAGVVDVNPPSPLPGYPRTSLSRGAAVAQPRVRDGWVTTRSGRVKVGRVRWRLRGRGRGRGRLGIC